MFSNVSKKSSVASKFAAFISLVTGFVVLTLGVSNQQFLHETGLELGGEQMEKTLQMLDPFVQSGFESMHSDLSVIANIPCIQTIARAKNNDGFDPIEGVSQEYCQNRLAGVLSLVMNARTDYLEINYVAVNTEEERFTHVDRSANYNSPVDESNYAKTGHKALYDTVLNMQEGELAFITTTDGDSVNLTQASEKPVITAVAPVFDPDGTLFGIVSISGDFTSIARNALNRFPWDWSLTMLDEQGNQVVEITSDTSNSSVAANQVADEPSDVVSFYRDVTIGTFPHEEGFEITARIPVDELVTQANLLTQRSLAIAGILLIVVMTISFLLSTRVVAPLLSLDRAIQSFGRSNSNEKLPIERKDEIGQIARSFSTLSDKLKHIQKAERRTYMQLKAIYEQSIDVLITINSSGYIESINKAAIELFGYEPEEIIGQNVKVLMPDPYRSNHDQFIKNYRDSRIPKIIGTTREVQGLTKDGRLLDLELSISEITFENQFVAYCGLLRDISERKDAEDKLKEYASELSKANVEYKELITELDLANDDLRTFTYIVSHDLRAPLVNLQGFTAQLDGYMQKIITGLNEGSFENLSEELNNLINVRVPKATAFIASSTTKMQTQLDAILEVSRLGRFELAPASVKLEEIFVSIFESHLGENWQDHVSMDLNSCPALMIDEKAFRIVATNICSNAIKYQNTDRDLQITVTANYDQSGFTLQILDNGRGIEPQDLNKVFELFRRCGRPDTKGEGVGLTYSKTLVARMGGSIWCESTMGEGTTFSVNIPVENCKPVSEAA